ncbi:MAG: hypothetical protein P1V35_02525 [Planctomycetota bacterium]|nr:hypothetical protein [Planctomycetota bacterium]
MKLPDIPISLCSYCAMPVMVAGQKETDGASPNAGRIAKIQGHKTFEDAMAHNAQEIPDYFTGGRFAWHGRNFVILAVVLVGLGAVFSSSSALLPWSAFAVVALLLGLFMIVKGNGLKSKAIADPISKRPGMIVDRRSETEVAGWNGATCYYFTIEFEDGAVGEYGFSGRGATEDPYPTGMTGLAYLRGANLLEFKHIRV